MAIPFRLGIWAVAVPLMAAGPCSAQTSEADEVQQLHAPKVTPASDAKKPNISEAVKIVVQQTNDFRKKEGKTPVKINEKLSTTAQYFADYMARTDRYGHKADEQGPADRAKKHGYDYCIILENIAYRYDSRGFSTQELGDGFFTGWKESPGPSA